MKVLFEGPPDEILLKCLGVKATKDGRHKSGVLKELTKREGLVGLVDEDPKNTQSRPKTMNEFRFIEKKLAVELYCHRDNDNYLIVLCPDLESWIIKAAKMSKVDLDLFNLPKKASALHNIINSRLSNTERLINELVVRKNPAVL